MAVLINTTKSEIEAFMRYARIGANNCMIGHSWEIEEVVRCGDCKWWDFTDQGSTLTPFSGRCKRVYRLWADRDAFCSYGERREDEAD